MCSGACFETCSGLECFDLVEIRKIQYLKLSLFVADSVSIDSLLLGVGQMMIGFPKLDSERVFFAVSLYFPLSSWYCANWLIKSLTSEKNLSQRMTLAYSKGC